MSSHKFRLFQFAQCCIQSGRVIDLVTAIQRGLVEVNGCGVCRVSDDLVDLGNHTERGHKSLHGQIVAAYFA